MSWVFYCVLFHLIASPVKLQGTEGCDEDKGLFVKEAKKSQDSITINYENYGDFVFPVKIITSSDSTKDATMKLNHQEKTYIYTDVSLVGDLGPTAAPPAATSTEVPDPNPRDSEEDPPSPNVTYVRIPGGNFRFGEAQIAFIQGFFFIEAGDTAGKYRLIGFNQQWKGCPQPLCVIGTLDSAYTLGAETYLVRGKHVWTLNAYRVTDAKPFKTLNPNIPLYTDAAFVYSKAQPVEKYFSRAKELFCETEDHKHCQGLNSYYVQSITSALETKDFAPDLLHATTFYPGNEEVLVLQYKSTGEVYMRRFMRNASKIANSRFTDPSQCVNRDQNDAFCRVTHGLLKNGADAMFIKDTELVIIQQNSVLKGDLSKYPATNVNMSEFTASFSEDKTYNYLFKCEDAIYTDTFSINKDFFGREFNRLFEPRTVSDIEQVLESMKKGFTSATRDSLGRVKAYLPYILGVVLTLVIIVIVAIIVTERRRRIRKRLRIIRLKKRGLVDNRAGALDEIHAHRSHLDDDILMDTYTPGKKLKTVYKKVPPGKAGNLSRTGSSLSVKSTTVKSPNTLKTVGSRALDNDLALDSKQGSKIFGKGKKSTVGSRLSVKTSKR